MNRVIRAVAVIGAGLMAVSANAAIITNGSFELGTDPGVFSTENVGSTAITGWTVGGFGVDYIGSYWQASDGVRSIDLSALSSGSLSQTIATVAGTTYTVTFDVSGNPDGGLGNKVLVSSISGSLPNVISYEITPGNSRSNMNWLTYSYDFTAFSNTSVLTFASAEFSPFGPAIDNVSIVTSGGGGGATVPEPSVWAMLLIGFGAVGFAARARKGHQVNA
ncbi:choice-of-anchor C family PEP-CTERM protein [Polymorphobacter fuscus]|uniref:Choice-of-anchor C family protein n=1 Tax=Sandarakinorhabdus fusca TaxID=1439888 RepID=A0A7C9GPR2_9SPHN|nr:choice-of-anchor C family protein [Polymorphobacter fuscus]KAB7648395.1 choice-of-anchor C family protein [Polymorphobacter fuscus]MQT15911.1 choice-of-anchor C family protein [Polymorphobacter fuscus]NJC07813.1 choice-of-anchor C domain-containing protein [Polymorphobacter fuscus]